MPKREYELRNNAIREALDNGTYAICPYGTGKKFIWDNLQDNLIEIISNENMEQKEICSKDFNTYHEDINLFICNEHSDSKITSKIELHITNDLIYGFSTENGTVFFPKEWKSIDWDKCGF